MNDEVARIDTNALIDELERRSDSIDTAVSYISAVRGAAHFRECIKELLKGTPYAEPVGDDFEGLYGRVRNAINDAIKVQAIKPLEAERNRLRAALVGLVGVDGRADLEQMEGVMRLMPAPAEDKAATIDAIHALLATVAPDGKDGNTL